MSNPVLGYASKTDAALAMREDGKRPRDIAKILGIKPKDVSALICSRNRSHARKQVSGGYKVQTYFPLDVRQALGPHARRRDIPVDRLILDLVTRIAEDGLVDAVLDDGARQ